MAISIAGGVRPGKVIEIERRLYKQLIVGKHKANAMPDELSVELEQSANKLDIERQALKVRLEKQAKEKNVFLEVSAQLTHTVNHAIEHQLAHPQMVLEASGISESQILLLDLLLHSDLNINRLRPIIESISWLSRDLINLINSPASGHRRPKHTDVQVTDIKLVLNYIGIENLRLLIPYFCLRHWLPSGNANLLWITRKLRRYSMVSAIAAQTLAELHNEAPSLAYSCALMYQFSTSIILSQSGHMFDNTWGTWLREASHSGEKQVYDAIMATDFPAQAVLDQVIQHSHRLNWQLLTLLKFEDSPITLVLKELDHDYHFTELSADAAIVAKASCYAKVLLLEEQQQIDPQEKRIMFDYYQFSDQELIRLKGQNFRKLDLL
ncbi:MULTISPECIES: HDOD domain-containing protein [Shewanella]|uniref:HDOD domain-containing protein n=1 Tax=Shewanella psychromarinicola TaxID=2487742 RepID=A0A3N4EHA0_9GAMM|nr:HDOD domain-containing protein [Shewanella psychromarinicola]AZG34933.1 HDOD domain-containing protein [Shewanella psychromarinicola]MCL1080648.1 HDOD domain-containing protein [Shewanella psychromarinicola]RPA33271.1 HDOD domain-containing protein [Shewanella psychromarinicola]